jgi:ParB family transcriptional regulator, chromosome partitioning protein
MKSAQVAGSTENPANQKQDHKLAEKRRALGRGLESLLPGPRAQSPTAPSAAKPHVVPNQPLSDQPPPNQIPSNQARPSQAQPNQVPHNEAPAKHGGPTQFVVTQGLSTGSSQEYGSNSVHGNKEEPTSSIEPNSSNELTARSIQGSAAATESPRTQYAADVGSGPSSLENAKASSATSASVRNSDRAGDVVSNIHASTVSDGEVEVIEIEQIDLNPYQTRQLFDEQQLTELAASIEVQGVLQPIAVRPAPPQIGPDGKAGRQRYILILGERRLRASKMLGLKTIPAVTKRVSDQTAAEMTLVENLQRADLDCLEQASAFKNLSMKFALTQEAIGKRVGISREQVSNFMRLLNLPADVYLALQKKQLTYSHARLLLMLHSDEHRSKLAQAAVNQKMSVAKLEELVMATVTSDPKEKRPGIARWQDPNVRAAQRSIEEAIGMRVKIIDRRGKGKITIEYGSLEDFDRVVGRLRSSTS